MKGRSLGLTVSLVALYSSDASIATVDGAVPRVAGKDATRVQFPCRFFVLPPACCPRAPPFLLLFFSKEGQGGSMVSQLLICIKFSAEWYEQAFVSLMQERSL